MLKFNNFVTFKELCEKSAFLKRATQAFEAEDFLNIFLRFSGFEAYLLIQFLLTKIKKGASFLLILYVSELWTKKCAFSVRHDLNSSVPF